MSKVCAWLYKFLRTCPDYRTAESWLDEERAIAKALEAAVDADRDWNGAADYAHDQYREQVASFGELDRKAQWTFGLGGVLAGLLLTGSARVELSAPLSGAAAFAMLASMFFSLRRPGQDCLPARHPWSTPSKNWRTAPRRLIAGWQRAFTWPTRGARQQCVEGRSAPRVEDAAAGGAHPAVCRVAAGYRLTGPSGKLRSLGTGLGILTGLGCGWLGAGFCVSAINHPP